MLPEIKFSLNLHQAMDTTQLENHKLELDCIEAFKQGDHDEASRLFSCLQQPAAVTTHVSHLLQSDLTCTNVSLLHLAALHGWMDIVASLLSIRFDFAPGSNFSNRNAIEAYVPVV